jgi:hypothetical protein
VTFEPEPGIIVPKAPPDAIEEVPPDQKPEGQNVTWIPGYWAWDDDRGDFIWISGIWRALPPGRQWVPGYWGQCDQGAQWTNGYWLDAKVTEVEYLPEPPATVEVGPNTGAPSAEYLWVPGCWVWHHGRYAWRPGYWALVRPDWVWVPAHYVCTPSGYVFIDGYWDYSLRRRGVLFAPVCFQASVYRRRGFFYSPAIVIDPTVFTDCLFLRPHYCHYYFGDYYAASHQQAGIYACFSFHNHYGYDPIYAHERWEHRHDREWEHHVEADFKYRREHLEARPPHTLAAQMELSRSGLKPGQKSFTVAMSLDQLAKKKGTSMRFQPVAKEERERIAQHGLEIQKFRDERQRLETKAPGPVMGEPPKAAIGTPPKGTLEKLPKGTITTPPKATIGTSPKGTVETSPKGMLEKLPKGTIETPPKGTIGTPPKGTLEKLPTGKIETPPKGTLEKPAKGYEPRKVTLPKSTIVSKPVDKLGKEHTPPKALEAPKPDLKIEPKPKKTPSTAPHK